MEENEDEQLLPGCVLTESIAIADVKVFIDEIVDDYIPSDTIKTSYPRILRAVMLGKIILSDDPLVYTLREPIKNPAGEITVTEIKFKTRVTTEEQNRLSKGMDLKKDKLEFGFKCMAFIIGQPVAMLSKFGRNDYKFIEEITQLFL